jgi:hypothetical protein
MNSFSRSRLWTETLAERPGDPHGDQRRILRDAFLRIRDRVANLVSHIHSDFRDYTVHDITHLDALWGIASNLMGPQYFVSPTEGFVLGCSFLIHDAGMTLAAYPNGIADLEKHAYWPLVGRRIGETESESRSAALILEMVRLLHAERAAELIDENWYTPDGTLQAH